MPRGKPIFIYWLINSKRFKHSATLLVETKKCGLFRRGDDAWCALARSLTLSLMRIYCSPLKALAAERIHLSIEHMMHQMELAYSKSHSRNFKVFHGLKNCGVNLKIYRIRLQTILTDWCNRGCNYLYGHMDTQIFFSPKILQWIYMRPKMDAFYKFSNFATN